MAESAKGKMELPDESAGAPESAHANERPSPAPASGRQTRVLISVFLAAVSLVAAISVLTNRMPARWDVVYYLDMATNGLAGNHRLATPFAYRPVVPLTVGAIARVLHADPETTFHAATHVIAVILLVLMFYWTRSFGGSELAAWCGMLALGLNFEIVRYPVFIGAMLDVYGYLFVLLAFWGVLRRRFYPTLLLCAARYYAASRSWYSTTGSPACATAVLALPATFPGRRAASSRFRLPIPAGTVQ